VQAGNRAVLRMKQPVQVESGTASARLLPAARSEIVCDIDFESRVIGRQSFAFIATPENFRKDIAPARTFGFLKDADELRRLGFARGATLQNTLVIDKDSILNSN